MFSALMSLAGCLQHILLRIWTSGLIASSYWRASPSSFGVCVWDRGVLRHQTAKWK